MKKGKPLRQRRSPLLKKSGLVYPARKTRKKMPVVSKKRKALNKEYSEKRKVFLAQYPLCQICLDIRRRHLALPSTEIHHRAGRYQFLLREDTWLAVCPFHHRYLHDNPHWAKLRGYILGPWERRLLNP